MKSGQRWQKLFFVLAAVATCVIVAGVAYAGSTRSNRTKAPVVKKAPAVKKAKVVSHAKAKAKASRSRARQGSENTAGDPDNVQQGDQSGPETPDQGESSQPESSGDTEQGQPGEPAQGHEDPPGDVNHECTGNCQE